MQNKPFNDLLKQELQKKLLKRPINDDKASEGNKVPTNEKEPNKTPIRSSYGQTQAR